MTDHPQTQVNVQPAQMPAGGVMITPKDMYDDIQAIKIAVVGLPSRVSKLESDVDRIKGRVLMMSGGAGALGAVAGLVLPVFIGR